MLLFIATWMLSTGEWFTGWLVLTLLFAHFNTTVVRGALKDSVAQNRELLKQLEKCRQMNIRLKGENEATVRKVQDILAVIEAEGRRTLHNFDAQDNH